MVLPGVFARSRPALARYDVSPHMVKWWKAQRPDDGQQISIDGGVVWGRARKATDHADDLATNSSDHDWKLTPVPYLHLFPQITRHLSPYEQQAIMPFVRDMPKRAYDKFTSTFMYWGTCGVIVLGTAYGADAADAAQDRTHRF
eukprot:scaffold318778_cov63-Attheya_sp.AAC.2